MPGKWAKSAPRLPFGLPELLVAIHTSRLSCGKAENARTCSRRFGSHLGNPSSSRQSDRQSSRGIPAW
jgi:hypothetical protein